MAKHIYLLRWLLSPVVVVVAFFISGIASGFLAELFGLWYEPSVGFIAAFCVVMSAYIIAPEAKQWIGIIAFLVGAIVAWNLIGVSSYPEKYSEPYKLTYLPLITTYIGGILGVILCFVLEKIIKPNKQLKHDAQNARAS